MGVAIGHLGFDKYQGRLTLKLFVRLFLYGMHGVSFYS